MNDFKQISMKSSSIPSEPSPKHILFCYYGDMEKSARAMELLDIMLHISQNITVISRGGLMHASAERLVLGQQRPVDNFLKFVQEAKRWIRQHQPDVVVLRDNYCAPLLKWIRKNNISTFVLYDSAELYFQRKPRSIKDRVALFLLDRNEEKYLRQADFVLAANDYRAYIMKGIFHLRDVPTVFDNNHPISVPLGSECIAKYDAQHKDFYQDTEVFGFLYAGGLHGERGTYDLARYVMELGPSYRLLICGSCDSDGQIVLERMKNETGQCNVDYIGFVNMQELRYHMQQSHAVISIYPLTNINNIFCASGKVVEGLMEGKPALLSNNPPLADFCRQTGAGISTADLKAGMVELRSNYDKYRLAAETFRDTFDRTEHLSAVTEAIRRTIAEHQLREDS